jgi:hypothetical protein
LVGSPRKKASKMLESIDVAGSEAAPLWSPRWYSDFLMTLSHPRTRSMWRSTGSTRSASTRSSLPGATPMRRRQFSTGNHPRWVNRLQMSGSPLEMSWCCSCGMNAIPQVPGRSVTSWFGDLLMDDPWESSWTSHAEPRHCDSMQWPPFTPVRSAPQMVKVS